METRDISRSLVTLAHELLHGPERPGQAYMLNTGDVGLLRSLDAISAAGASSPSQGGATIAAHVDHLRFGLSLMNEWSGGVNPWDTADFTASWRISTVSDSEWQEIRSRFRSEAERWLDAMRARRELTDEEANILLGAVAHLAYHVGAIRQIDKAARGPGA
jgi:hypothetical protein